MPTRVSYLLVLQPMTMVGNRKPAYEIQDIETSEDIYPHHEIRMLLNDATRAITYMMDLDSPRRVSVRCYKALKFLFSKISLAYQYSADQPRR